MSLYLRKNSTSSTRLPDISRLSTSPTSNSHNVKLPKFEKKVFSGKDPTEWSLFYESFLEAIDKNECLADIEKMNS